MSDAVAELQRRIAADPADAAAQLALGNALVECGRPADAIAPLQAAAARRPDFAAGHYNLGNALLAAGQPEAADACFATALRLEPGHAGAHNNRGNALRALGRIEDAAASYARALALRPDLAGAHNNLGSALLALHRPAAAAAALGEALRLDPDYAEACNNLGGAMLALDRPEEAVALFRRAVALDPALAQAAFGESLALLTLGRYREGWERYEARWRDPRFCEDQRSYDRPLWLNAPGTDLAGHTLLLHAEQGLGDSIQFVRYVRQARRLGARVLLEVQAPLVRLFSGLADAVLPAGAELPPYDLHCPLMSLPHAFRTEVATIPTAIPYLWPEPALLQAWRERLGPRRALRVGIAVSGSAEHPEDVMRSIPAADLRALLATPGVEFHVVQSHIRAPDAAVFAAFGNLRPHADALADFADTAALLAVLDLLISVDTSVAHLGGAMGRPVWLLLQSNADFRWLRAREDSPWYPALRLFRQTEPGRWGPVLARVADALRTRAAG